MVKGGGLDFVLMYPTYVRSTGIVMYVYVSMGECGWGHGPACMDFIIHIRRVFFK